MYLKAEDQKAARQISLFASIWLSYGNCNNIICVRYRLSTDEVQSGTFISEAFSVVVGMSSAGTASKRRGS